MECHTYLIAKTLVEFHEDHSLASRGVDLALLLAVPLTVSEINDFISVLWFLLLLLLVHFAPQRLN